MEIENKVGKNFFKCFNEARGVALAKRRLFKNKKSKTFTYLDNVLMILILLLLISILFLLIPSLHIFAYILVLIVLLSILSNVIYLLYVYFIRKNKHMGKTIIDDNGITNDSFQNIKMIFSWDKIKMMIVKKYSITILTDTSCYFFFDISYYDKENLIVENTK